MQRIMLQPGVVATTVVCLTQVVAEDELRDDEEYEDIMEDMRQEGGKFGKRCLFYNAFYRSFGDIKIKSILICLSVFLGCICLFYSLLL